MKSQEKVHIFLYSNLLNQFDTFITSIENLEHLQLRARFNTHKNLNVYGLKLTPAQVKSLNKKLSLSTDNDIKIFDSLENKIIVGF